MTAQPPSQTTPTVRIGVLALQGSFREHSTLLHRCPGVEPLEVRTAAQLKSCHGLIIPGGESTTMALVAQEWDLMEDLRSFVREQKRPVWGTCAGMIFLSDRCTGGKQGGQALVGGLDCLVSRNFFGAQIKSFEANIPAPECLSRRGGESAGAPCRALFIRAPAFLELGEGVESLMQLQLGEERRQATGLESVCVACRSGNILASAFHPELTADSRWHQLFADMVAASTSDPACTGPEETDSAAKSVAPHESSHKPPEDLPVFGPQSVFDTTLLSTPTL